MFMAERQINLPYGAHKWVCEEDLSSLKKGFIIYIMDHILRGEEIIENGVINEYDHVLFRSVLTEMLIVTRNLLWSFNKLCPNDETTIEYEKIIKLFRDRFCHLESDGWRDGTVIYRQAIIPLNYDESMPWINKQMEIDETKIKNADDIAIFSGSDKLWVKKELLTSFEYVRNYFIKKLPDDYNFRVRCRNFKNAN